MGIVDLATKVTNDCWPCKHQHAENPPVVGKVHIRKDLIVVSRAFYFGMWMNGIYSIVSICPPAVPERWVISGHGSE